ncbi:beta strand repeat-containing protein, partial [Psychrobacter sp. 1Y11]|uniref:beta strand repeat-containing protein n=1 Tax=Psychrobacter sp. 1Y11 TaxID=3457446 RepID=UPI003FD25B19
LDGRTTSNTTEINKGIKFGNGTTNNKFALGDTINVKGDSNLTSTTTADGVQVSLNKNLDLGTAGSVKTGATTVNNDGIIITKAPGAPAGITDVSLTNTGLDNGGNTIVNVAAGVNGTDAVNVNQLDAVNTTANKGWNVKVNDTASDNVAPGETVQFVDGKNIKITRDNDQVIKVATSDEVEFTKVTLGDGTNNTILTSTANGLDVGGDKITNVAPGTISDTSTDAINGSQLFDTAESVANNLGGGTTVNTDGTLSAPSYELDDGNNTGTDVTVNNVGAALGNLDGRTTSNTTEINKGIKFGNGTTNNQFALGDTINVKGDSNLTSTTTADGVQLGLGDSISVGQTNPVTIDGNNGTVSGLTNTSFDPDANYTGGQAATQEQLAAVNNATNDTINQGFNIAGANGSPDNVQLGETVTYDSTDGSIVTTVSDNNVDFTLGNDLNVGGSGEDGLITVNGKDGKNGVTINGKDGTIGINGKDGANGIITVANGVAGVDGKDGITRVVIDDIEVATMQDGLKFAGNTGDTIAKQLNETLNIEGELAESATASGANLRVDSKDGKLNLVMAKNLTDLNSATFGEAGNRFTINQGGVQFVDAAGNKRDNTPSMTAGGIDAGNNQITNVASGMTNVDGDVVTDINVANPNNGANIGDIQNTTTGLIDTGFNISADNSALADSKTVDNVKLGETVDFTNSDGNLVATVTDNGINYDLAENINVTSVTTGNTTLNNAGITIVNGANNTITLDGNGLNNGGNRIVNVAAGEVSTTSQDAINGGQLFGTANSIANNFGGGSTVNADGIVSAPNYVLDNGNGGTTAYDNVGDALGGLDNRVSTNADNITDITNGTAGIVRQDPDTGDITVGGQTGGTNVDFSGTEGDRVLTGAADGQVAADSNDVINGGQLFEQGSGVAGIVGGNTTYNPEDGTFTNNNIGGTGQNNINDAIQAVGDAASAGKNTVSEGNNIVVTETVDADTGSTNYEVATDPDLVVDSVTATDDEGNETTLTATGTTIINADGKTNNSTALGNTITDGDNVTTVTGSGTNVTDGDNTANYGANGLEVTGTTGSTVLNQAGVSFTDNKGAATGPSITANGIDAGGKTITGVADGVEVNDAVNLGQLNALDSKLSNSVNDLGYKIGEVEDDANAGISAAMAMSSLPQAYIPGKSMVGGGVATYNGESAVAIGVSRVSDNGRWVMKINGTADTQGNAGGAIGAGFHF